MRASDIFKPHPTPPQLYYLKDHLRLEYSDSDWPTTPEGEEEANTEGGVNGLNHTFTAGDASMVVRARPPLGLLSVRMREHRKKGDGWQQWVCKPRNEGGTVRFSRYALHFISPYLHSPP